MQDKNLLFKIVSYHYQVLSQSGKSYWMIEKDYRDTYVNTTSEELSANVVVDYMLTNELTTFVDLGLTKTTFEEGNTIFTLFWKNTTA